MSDYAIARGTTLITIVWQRQHLSDQGLFTDVLEDEGAEILPQHT